MVKNRDKEEKTGKPQWKNRLVNDNSVSLTQILLAHLKWDIFSHQPYSPDLAPSNFHLFPAVKVKLGVGGLEIYKRSSKNLIIFLKNWIGVFIF